MTSIATTTRSPRSPRRRQPLGGWRLAVLIGVVSLAVTGGIYWIMIGRAAAGQSAAGLSMPYMHMQNTARFWAYPLSQSFGFSALVFSYIGVLFGLLQSAKRPRALPISNRQIDVLHRELSLTVIALTLLHAGVLPLDHMGDTVPVVLIPLLGASDGSGSFGAGLGIIAFWLAVVLGPTFYLRRRLGPRAWRIAHRFTAVVYVLAAWHTFAWGSDLHNAGLLRDLLWAIQIPLAAALLWRLLSPARQREQIPLRLAELRQRISTTLLLRLAGRVLVAGVLAGLVALVLTGRTGGSHAYHNPAVTAHPTSHTTGQSTPAMPGMNMGQ